MEASQHEATVSEVFCFGVLSLRSGLNLTNPKVQLVLKKVQSSNHAKRVHVADAMFSILSAEPPTLNWV